MSDTEVLPGETNISGFPHFVNRGDLDFSLAENPDCINAGDPDFELDSDNSITDIGAVEYVNTLFLPSGQTEKKYKLVICGNTICLESKNTVFEQLRIVNLNGQVIYKNFSERNRINVNLKNGFYLLSFKQSNRFFTEKVILL